MLESLPFLLTGITFGSAAGLVPGPTLTLVIVQTLRHGLREGLKVAISPLLADTPIVLTAIFVLGRIESGPVFALISSVGAVFLLYLAYESFTARPPAAGGASVTPGSLGKGFLANLFNPHPWIFWITIGAPTALRATDVHLAATGLFLLGHYGCLVGTKILIAVLVEKGRSRIGRGYRTVMNILGVALFVFALLFVREALGYAGLV